jgi:hypothetical protein
LVLNANVGTGDGLRAGAMLPGEISGAGDLLKGAKAIGKGADRYSLHHLSMALELRRSHGQILSVYEKVLPSLLGDGA